MGNNPWAGNNSSTISSLLKKNSRTFKDLISFQGLSRPGFFFNKFKDFPGFSTAVGTLLLRTALCRTSTFQNSHFVRIIKLWNYVCKSALPNCYDTLSNFKTYLHKTYRHLTVTAYTPDEPYLALFDHDQLTSSIPPRISFHLFSLFIYCASNLPFLFSISYIL